MCNLSACHRAPDLWEKPDSFHPQVCKEGEAR